MNGEKNEPLNFVMFICRSYFAVHCIEWVQQITYDIDHLSILHLITTAHTHEPLHLSNGMFGWAFWWECIQRATQPNLNSDSVSNVYQCSMSIATALPIIRLAKRVFSLNSLQPLAFRWFSEFLKNIFKLYNWKCFVIFDSHQPTKLTGLAVRMRKWDREWMKWKDECYNNNHRKTIETIQKHSTF